MIIPDQQPKPLNSFPIEVRNEIESAKSVRFADKSEEWRQSWLSQHPLIVYGMVSYTDGSSTQSYETRFFFKYNPIQKKMVAFEPGKYLNSYNRMT